MTWPSTLSNKFVYKEIVEFVAGFRPEGYNIFEINF